MGWLTRPREVSVGLIVWTVVCATVGMVLGVPVAQAELDRHGVGWGVRGVRPVSSPTEVQFDLGSDFERCLAAVEAAHLPGWMWECHEFEWQAKS